MDYDKIISEIIECSIERITNKSDDRNFTLQYTDEHLNTITRLVESGTKVHVTASMSNSKEDTIARLIEMGVKVHVITTIPH